MKTFCHQHSAIIIRVGNYAVHFHTNVSGRVYSLVADDEATPFETVAEAARKARDHGLKPGAYTIETLEAQTNL